MHSFIISSKNIEQGTNEAKLISSHEKVNDLGLEILEFDSLKIEDVRKIQSKIYLKPLKGKKKGLIIVLREGATTEAQNSMLKLLEEPPPSSLIFLITTNYLSLLPTVLSRAKIIELKEEKEVDGENLKQLLNIETEGDALFLAQEVSKDKTAAILWLEDVILAAREKMLDNLEDKRENLRLGKIIKLAQDACYDLQHTNTNSRLALENLFLSIY